MMTYEQQAWTKDEKAIVRQMVRAKKSTREIASALGRSRGAVAGQIYRLGLSRKREDRLPRNLLPNVIIRRARKSPRRPRCYVVSA
jgi:IS30 family transposase